MTRSERDAVEVLPVVAALVNGWMEEEASSGNNLDA